MQPYGIKKKTFKNSNSKGIKIRKLTEHAYHIVFSFFFFTEL